MTELFIRSRRDGGFETSDWIKLLAIVVTLLAVAEAKWALYSTHPAFEGWRKATFFACFLGTFPALYFAFAVLFGIPVPVSRDPTAEVAW